MLLDSDDTIKTKLEYERVQEEEISKVIEVIREDYKLFLSRKCPRRSSQTFKFSLANTQKLFNPLNQYNHVYTSFEIYYSDREHESGGIYDITNYSKIHEFVELNLKDSIEFIRKRYTRNDYLKFRYDLLTERDEIFKLP